MRRSVLWLFFVATLVVSVERVSAECAWVLWIEWYSHSGGKLVASLQQPADAYRTKEECQRALYSREKREEQDRKANPGKERYFSCLPDTIDPRGSKAR